MSPQPPAIDSGGRLTQPSLNPIAGRRWTSWGSASSVELQQLNEVTVRVLQRRDTNIRIVRRCLDELDARVLQALVVTAEIVCLQAHHVARGVGVPTVHLAVRPQRERRPFTRA